MAEESYELLAKSCEYRLKALSSWLI